MGKRAEIANLIVSTKPDIVVGTETWLDNTISNAEFFPAEYSIYRKDRNRNGGGVLIAVKNDIQCAELPELDVNGELIWIRITTQCGRHVLVCAFYRPDVSDEVGLQMLVTSLQCVAENNSSLLVAGDFNLPGWNWETTSLKPRAPYPAQHEWLIEKMQDMGLEQMSQEPTRIANILDLVFTNSPSLIPRIESIPGISDHDIVYFEFIVKPETRKDAVRPISLFSRANWDQMREDMSALQERYTEPVERTTEDLWLEFKTTLKRSMEANIPCKTPRRKDSHPWLTATY